MIKLIRCFVRNRNLKILKRYSKATRTRAPAYSRALRRIKRGFQRGVKRRSGPISRVPEGDRVEILLRLCHWLHMLYILVTT